MPGVIGMPLEYVIHMLVNPNRERDVSQNKAPVCLILASALLRGGGKRMAGNVTKLTVSFG